MGGCKYSVLHTHLEKITYTGLWYSATLECPSLHSLQSNLSTKHGQVWREILSLEFPHFTWFLTGVSLGRKMEKKKKRIYERELPHSYMTRGQRKITSEYFIVWTRMVTTILFSFIPGNQGQPDIFLFTSFHQGKKCPSSKAAVRMSLLWVWKTVLRISFKSLRSCSRLMPLICYVSKGNVTGKG